MTGLEVGYHGATEERLLAWIRELSDSELVRTYMLLSDERVVTNVRVLPELLAQIHSRNLPIGQTH